MGNRFKEFDPSDIFTFFCLPVFHTGKELGCASTDKAVGSRGSEQELGSQAARV